MKRFAVLVFLVACGGGVTPIQESGLDVQGTDKVQDDWVDIGRGVAVLEAENCTYAIYGSALAMDCED